MTEIEEPGDAMAAEVAKVAAPQTSFAGRLRNYFLTGLVVAGPLAITVVADLVDHHLGRRFRAAAYPAGLSPGKLSAVANSGHGPDHCVCRAHAARVSDRQPGWPTLVELGESLLSRMPIVRPIYKTMKQIFERCSPSRLELPQGRRWWNFRRRACGRWCSCRSRPSGDVVEEIAARRARLGVHALHAQPDHRLFLLREAQGSDRARHHGRKRDDAADLRRHGAAGCSDAQKKLASLAATAKAARARNRKTEAGRVG